MQKLAKLPLPAYLKGQRLWGPERTDQKNTGAASALLWAVGLRSGGLKKIFRRLIKESGQGLFFGGYKKNRAWVCCMLTHFQLARCQICALESLQCIGATMHCSKCPLETENNRGMSQTLKYLGVELVEEERGDCEAEKNEDRPPKYLQRVFITRHLEAFSEIICWWH